MTEKRTGLSPSQMPGDAEQKESPDFYNVPTSAATNAIMETFIAGDRLDDLPARKNLVNHSAHYEVKANDNARLLTIANSGATTLVEVEIDDIEKIAGNNKAAKKFFQLSLIEINKQALHNGEMVRDSVSYSLQLLVSMGMYSSIESARTGFKKARTALTSMKIQGRVRKSPKSEVTVDTLQVLFTGGDIKKGVCTLYLNPRVNWNFVVQYFTILPPYYFKLPNRASDLLYYIFYLARQNIDDILKNGYFTISFRAIQSRLQLPAESSTPNPERDIKREIENAITEIENANKEQYNTMEFSLLPVYDDNAKITEYLDKGYLKVFMRGRFIDGFQKLHDKSEKEKQKAQQRKEKIEDAARTKALTKKIEKESAAQLEATAKKIIQETNDE